MHVFVLLWTSLAVACLANFTLCIATASSKAIMQKVNATQKGYAYMMGHHRNFLDCVKTRSLPISNAEVSHRSVTTCHAGNICLRLGHKLRWDPDNEQFLNDDMANRMLERAMRSPWSLK